MTALLCPLFQEPQVTDNNEFLVGGLLWFYEAGSSTLTEAYTTDAGDVAWSNPIVLNSRGETGGTIWLTPGQSYRIVLEGRPYYGQSHGVVITEHDDISGIPVSVEAEEWVLFPGTPTYVSATSFTVVGDYRNIFVANRKIRLTDSGGISNHSITTSSFGAGVTTVNIDGTIDSGLSLVQYSFITPDATPDRFVGLVTGSLNVANNTMIGGDALVVGKLDVNSNVSVNGNVIVDGGVTVFGTEAAWSNINNTFDTADPSSGFIYFENGLRFYRGYDAITLVANGTDQTFGFVHTFSSPFPTYCFQVMATFGDFIPSSLAAYSPIFSVVSIDNDQFQYNIICRAPVPAGTYTVELFILAIGY